MKPTELDLNLDGMRANALREMIEAIRNGLQKCDDIEAMARVLHSRAATTIKGKVQPQVNGNGNGVSGQKRLGRPRGSRGGRTTDKYAVREASLAIIDKSGPDGVDSKLLEAQLRSAGIIMPTMSLASARALINMMLRSDAADKRIRAKRLLGLNGRIFYYPGDGEMTPPAAAKLHGLRLPARTAVDEDGIPRITKLRNFIASTLASQTAPVSVAEMHRAAVEIAGFDPKWGNGDTLRNQMGRVLREMLEAGTVKRFGRGRAGSSGIPYAYSIVRPKVSVTRNGS